jgi:hypothetical protein
MRRIIQQNDPNLPDFKGKELTLPEFCNSEENRVIFTFFTFMSGL